MYDHHEPTAYEMDLSLWSDLHKDVYGFRPRGQNPTAEELPAIFDALSRELEIVMAEEQRARLLKQKEIKAYVRECMSAGMTGEAAMQENFRMVGADRMYGWEDYCYLMGIGLRYARCLEKRIPVPGPAWGEHED